MSPSRTKPNLKKNKRTWKVQIYRSPSKGHQPKISPKTIRLKFRVSKVCIQEGQACCLDCMTLRSTVRRRLAIRRHGQFCGWFTLKLKGERISMKKSWGHFCQGHKLIQGTTNLSGFLLKLTNRRTNQVQSLDRLFRIWSRIQAKDIRICRICRVKDKVKAHQGHPGWLTSPQM